MTRYPSFWRNPRKWWVYLMCSDLAKHAKPKETWLSRGVIYGHCPRCGRKIHFSVRLTRWV